MTKKIIKLLYRSFDSELSEKEKQKLSKALENSHDLRQQKARVSVLRETLALNKKNHFRPYFADRVVQRIQDLNIKNDFFESLVLAFRRVAVVTAVISVILLSINMIQSDRLTLSAIFGIPEMTIEEVLVPTFPTSQEDTL